MTFDEWLISRLKLHGAYQSASDGVPGRRVHDALEAFQKAKSLPVTGLADAVTIDALRAPVQDNREAAPTLYPEPVWLREARRFMGLKEIAGAKSNATIIGWAKKLGGWIANFYKNDDIPWCGLFVANLIASTLPKESLPANPLSALAWAKFGISCKPCVGAIMVFTRKGGGHVGLYVGEDASTYHILGGNQSNSVSITRVAKSRFHSARWPASGGSPGRALSARLDGAVSQNEA